MSHLQSHNLMDIASKFPLPQHGDSHTHAFADAGDGIERSATLVHIKRGFQWTECMPKGKGGPSDAACCPATHFGYMLKGEVAVTMLDGSGEDKTLRAGDAYFIAPGHDAVVTEDVEMIDFVAKESH